MKNITMVLAGAVILIGCGQDDSSASRKATAVVASANHIDVTGPEGAPVLRSVDGGAYERVGTISNGVWVDTNIEDGREYDYRLGDEDAEAVAPWSRFFETAGSQDAASIALAADGGFFVVGETYTDITWDARVLRLDAAGNLLWERTLGTEAGSDWASSIAATPDGGCVMAGQAGWGIGEAQGWLVKLDADGATEWERTLDGDGYREFITVIVTADGGIVAAGHTDVSGSFADFDVVVARYDAAGTLEWESLFGGAGWQWACGYSMQMTELANGDLAIPATTDALGSVDAWVLRITADGAPVWDITLGGARTDGAVAVRPAGAGLMVLAQRQQADETLDATLYALSGAGDVLGETTIGGAGNDTAFALAPVAEGGWIVAGAAGSDFWLTKLDADGVTEWSNAYGSAGDESSFSMGVVETADGGFVTAGRADASLWALKVGRDGTVNLPIGFSITAR